MYPVIAFLKYCDFTFQNLSYLANNKGLHLAVLKLLPNLADTYSTVHIVKMVASKLAGLLQATARVQVIHSAFSRNKCLHQYIEEF